MGIAPSLAMPLAAILLCAALAAAQDAPAPPPPPASTAPATRPGLPAMRIDPQARTIEIEARVALRQGPLELLLCHRLTKEYESILATDAQGSHVHAALLALGLDPGRAGYWQRLGDGNSVYSPPAGAPLEITLRWRDAQGRDQQAPAHQWLAAQESGNAPRPFGWVFVGSSPVEEGPYWADQTGDIISLANYEASVIDVPFASSRDNSLLTFAARTAAIPPEGTPVTVTIRPAAGAERAPVASAVIEIDRFGRYSVETKSLSPADVEAWAEAFRARHARPCVLVLAAPQALAYDIDQLKRALGRASIDDVEVRTSPSAQPPLPRTGVQAAGELESWQKRLAGGPDGADSVAEQARAMLSQIDQGRRELAELLTVWDDYRRQLAQVLPAHRRARLQAASAPASTPSGAP
jgi:hypothetical protein